MTVNGEGFVGPSSIPCGCGYSCPVKVAFAGHGRPVPNAANQVVGVSALVGSVV